MSTNLFAPCPSCGKQVLIEQAKCPNCGAKVKKLSVIEKIGIGLGILILISLVLPDPPDKNQTANSKLHNKSQANNKSFGTNKATASIPKDQELVISILEEYKIQYLAAKNDLQRSSIRRQRGETLNKINNYYMKNWEGKLVELATNSEGDAIITIQISQFARVKTFNNAFSDSFYKSIIEQGTTLYNSLMNLSTKDRVRFSGTFYPSGTMDYFFETSMTEHGSLTEPEFLMKFESVEKI